MVKSMKNCVGISRVSMRAASSALTLAVALFIGIATTQMAPAQSFGVLYNFTGSTDGGWPYTFLIRDTAGNLYGTTETGGAGFGTVFKLTKAGKESVLYSFTGGADGANPLVGVVRD